MRQLDRSALMPYPATAMYALVADVAAYPQFLPGCVASQIEADEIRDAARWVRARVGFRVKGLADSFATENRMVEPLIIEMRLLDGPFRSLAGTWTFTPLADAACKVSLTLSVEFANRLMEATLAPWMDRAVNGLIEAFRARAQQATAG